MKILLVILTFSFNIMNCQARTNIFNLVAQNIIDIIEESLFKNSYPASFTISPESFKEANRYTWRLTTENESRIEDHQNKILWIPYHEWDQAKIKEDRIFVIFKYIVFYFDHDKNYKRLPIYMNRLLRNLSRDQGCTVSHEVSQVSFIKNIEKEMIDKEYSYQSSKVDFYLIQDLSSYQKFEENLFGFIEFSLIDGWTGIVIKKFKIEFENEPLKSVQKKVIKDIRKHVPHCIDVKKPSNFYRN